SPSLDAALAAMLGVESVGLTCSGTASLIVVLETLKRRSTRRTVVVPAYTCPLVPIAVARVGLKVKQCDLRPARFDFHPDALAGACGPDSLAIVPTHLGGMASDLAPVLEAAKQCGAVVVEDAAQALGASWRGRPVGTVGEVGIYSLSRGKGLTLYEGGFWVARDRDLRAAIEGTSKGFLSRRPAMEFWRFLQLVGYGLL